jgi:glycolate oxidase FAD binding subunit
MRDLRAMVSGSGGTLTVHEESDGIWGRWYDAFAPRALSLRCSVLPSQIAETLDALERRLADAAPTLSATVSAGLIRANAGADDSSARALVDAARDAIERSGGSMVIDAAPVDLKREVDVFGPLRADFAIMRRLKEQFDPGRTLSPGRFAGRL